MSETSETTGEVELTGRQMDALRELYRYGISGAMQPRLARDGVSRSLLINLWGKGLAERLETPIGVAWFISSDGSRAIGSSIRSPDTIGDRSKI